MISPIYSLLIISSPLLLLGGLGSYGVQLTMDRKSEPELRRCVSEPSSFRDYYNYYEPEPESPTAPTPAPANPVTSTNSIEEAKNIKDPKDMFPATPDRYGDEDDLFASLPGPAPVPFFVPPIVPPLPSVGQFSVPSSVPSSVPAIPVPTVPVVSGSSDCVYEDPRAPAENDPESGK